MHRIAFSLLLATGLVAAGSASANASAVVMQTPAPEVATRAAGDQIICKNRPIIGSRLNQRLCMTKRRWDQMHNDGQEFLRDIDQRSSGGQQGP